jgi:hypothetical protein
VEHSETHHLLVRWFGFAQPTLQSCVALRARTKSKSHLRQSNPSGKSLLIYGNRVKPQYKKYFDFPEGRNSGISVTIPARSEGRIMIVTNVGWGAVDAGVPTTNGAAAYGKDVWS